MFRPTRSAFTFFPEYKSTGPGANPTARVTWSQQLTEAGAAAYTIPNILGGADHGEPNAP